MASLLALGQFYLMREDCLESHGLHTFLREASQWRTLHFLGPSALKHLCRMLDSRCPWVKQQLHCFRRHVDGKNHYLKTSSVLPRAIFLPSLEAGIVNLVTLKSLKGFGRPSNESLYSLGAGRHRIMGGWVAGYSHTGKREAGGTLHVLANYSQYSEPRNVA